jgi:hypothetical protein
MYHRKFALGAVWLPKHRVSDNVGGVKQFSSTLPHALEQERHFALDEKGRSNQGSLVINSGQELSPPHPSLRSHSRS